MAQEPSPAPAKTPWTKIFTAFKIALDLKKLALAALGILFVWLGWLAIGGLFYELRKFPEWKNFEVKEKTEEKQAQWDYFKAKRASWNLLYELAGSPMPEERKNKIDVADVAQSPEEYEILADWEQKYRRWADESVTLSADKKALKIGGSECSITPAPEDAAAFAKLPETVALGRQGRNRWHRQETNHRRRPAGDGGHEVRQVEGVPRRRARSNADR